MRALELVMEVRGASRYNSPMDEGCALPEESDEDVLLRDMGHVPVVQKIGCQVDMSDEVRAPVEMEGPAAA